VGTEGIRLTTYFTERHRGAGAPPGDDLIDLYRRLEVAASIVLRDAAVIAVDTRPKIEAVLDQTLRLSHPLLVTTEQTQLLTGDIKPVRLSENPGEATRLTVYFGRQDRVYQVPAFEVVCELLYRRGVAGATILPGIDGTMLGRRHRGRFLHRDADVPLTAVAVSSGDQIGMVLPEVGALFRHPLMTVEKVRVCKRDGHLIGRPELPPGPDNQGAAARLKLTVYTSEAARHDGQPVHRELVRRLRSAGITDAASQRGVWGFHGNHAPHGERFPHLARHIPAVTTAICRSELVSAAFDIIDALTSQRGLVTAETLQAVSQAPSVWHNES